MHLSIVQKLKSYLSHYDYAQLDSASHALADRTRAAFSIGGKAVAYLGFSPVNSISPSIYLSVRDGAHDHLSCKHLHS